MNTKTDATVRGIKDLGNEVSAWEVRVLALKSESQELQNRNAYVKKEIESSLAITQVELDKRRNESRELMAKAKEAGEKLESEREEFQKILVAFRKEKTAFEDERQGNKDNAKRTEDLRQKLSNFVLMIRREAEFL